MRLPQLYNTLTRQTETLALREPGRVGIYCCGPTPYDLPHAGHARPAVAFDVLIRQLRAKGLEVTYVRNFTDVDDNILNRAKQRGEAPLDLSARISELYRQQYAALNCVAPAHEPKVSEHIPEIIDIIERLVACGSAYAIQRSDGTCDVYFSVRSFPEYGKLSRRKLDDLQVGARIEKDDTKQDPLDFALWKGAKPEEWGWPSPWGHGRPGWHIECSAMCRRYLGHDFEVHCGGMDLMFPHHENEIAQSEAAYPGQGPLARVWLHNGFINVDREKMSKSLGNFVTITDILERNDPEAFRWYLLTVHYRGPIQFETEKLADGRVVFPGIDEAEKRMDYVYGVFTRLESLAAKAGAPGKMPPELRAFEAAAGKATEAASAALDDDLNTPVALAELGELARAGNELCDLAEKRRKDAALQAAAAQVARTLSGAVRAVCELLGLAQATPEEYARRTRERRLRLRGLTEQDVNAEVERRARARDNKAFADADAIRQSLLARGIVLRDAPTGTEWSVLP